MDNKKALCINLRTKGVCENLEKCEYFHPKNFKFDPTKSKKFQPPQPPQPKPLPPKAKLLLTLIPIEARSAAEESMRELLRDVFNEGANYKN
jgi:hypothetical protein